MKKINKKTGRETQLKGAPVEGEKKVTFVEEINLSYIICYSIHQY